jgi:hypothetical protein
MSGKNENNHPMDGFARKGLPTLKAALRPSTRETAVRCRVAGAACVRASAATVAETRRRPIEIGTHKLPASFLKHAEDQTVVAMMAVLRVLEDKSWQARSFADWGVIAAPNFFGRAIDAQTIERFHQEGAWGVSPHLIPHQSLHALSGTISQALKIYGPNFGIGGGANSAPDAFLIAASMLCDALPGLWLILASHESEWIPPTPPPVCQAIAVALTPDQTGDRGMHLSLGQIPAGDAIDPHWPDLHLNLLAEEWTLHGSLPEGHWRLADNHWLEFAEADA